MRAAAIPLLVPLLLVTLSLAPATRSLAWADPAPSARPEDASARRRGWVIASSVIAACLLAGGGALGGVALSRSTEQNGNVSSPPLYDAGLRARGLEGQSMASAAYAMLGVGAAIAVVDVAVWIDLWRSSARAPRAAAPSAGTTSP